MSAPYHGVTVADVVLMVTMMGGNVTRDAVYVWLSRGQITRSRNGMIDPESVINWWEIERNRTQAARRTRVA